MRDAGVVSHVPYVQALERLKLLHNGPDGYIVNNALRAEEVNVSAGVRKIRPSTRFEIFQRDNHTCQYCGRSAPDVELEVDHLVAVAQGGDDAVTNLITACRDCNAGKGSSLIAAFTGGRSRDEWRAELHRQREVELERRRAEIEPVIAHWEECRGHRISDYDRRAVHAFLDRYESEWVKSAIEIAKARGPSNHVKYVGGILRRWGRSGRPLQERDWLRDEALSERPATEKQIAYAEYLLRKHDVSIDDLASGASFERLTMLEAKVIIDELTREEEATPPSS